MTNVAFNTIKIGTQFQLADSDIPKITYEKIPPIMQSCCKPKFTAKNIETNENILVSKDTMVTPLKDNLNE